MKKKCVKPSFEMGKKGYTEGFWKPRYNRPIHVKLPNTGC